MIDINSLRINHKYNDFKKALGQYFTNQNVASYMSSMFHKIEESSNNNMIRLLDPGAGSGSLSFALIQQCVFLGYKNIELVVYEIDADLIPILHKVLQEISQYLKSNAISFNYKIEHRDFVTERPDKKVDKFDFCIMNPPYFKYLIKKSKYGGKTADLFKGDPNIYASFMAVGLNCLKNNGQMVVIVPRSFTNGLYFKGFREYLTKEGSLEKIHIFKSRDKVFKDSNVLQESIICKITKSEQKENIEIASSTCDKDIKNANINIYPFPLIIDNTENMNIIHIPETIKDSKIMLKANSLSSTFEKEGYFISTGKIVGFRTKEFITTKKLKNSVPVLKAHNIKAGVISWDGKHKKDTLFILKENYEKHINIEDIYVLIKRFTAKDDKRRLVSAVYEPFYNKDVIGFDNKINYIGRKESNFDFTEASGLSAVLNSTFMDKYFRCFSGNTQVNATEIRIMKFPKREVIINIGKDIIKTLELEQYVIDKIVEKHLWRK